MPDASTGPRVLLVSHRLPVTARVVDGIVSLEPSAGGLATGLGMVHRAGAGVWIGSPGDVAGLPPDQAGSLRQQMADARLVEVPLTHEQHEVFYEEFSNGVIWPLFHYMLDRIPLSSSGWHTYREVNQLFADAVVEAYRPGDVVWIHDYHLLLVPGMLRRRVPDARIGFFLHIPFPSFEVFRTLPWRREMLTGMLGADIIGFHTASYIRYFTRAVQQLLGQEPSGDVIQDEGRDVRVRACPMGIDAEAFATIASDPDVQAEAAAIRQSSGGRRIILGVDRLDYTKGIPRRLLAFERLLERDPQVRDEVRMIQVAVPSRSEVEPYRAFTYQLNEIVGRINGAFATSTSVPIHYLYRSISRQELVALYLAADVMAVTPVRDGMNLVAKEFAASRVDDDGVLLLSEFAGAAEELTEAILVNPYDIEATADAMQHALRLPEADRQSRMRALRQRVHSRTVHRWASAFVQELQAIELPIPPAVPAGSPPDAVERVMAIDDPVLLLDYDGTLVSIENLPQLARPDADLLPLLRALTEQVQVHLISGRSRTDLDAWFEGLPVTIWAEHGACVRREAGVWDDVGPTASDWMGRVRPILEWFTACTPGTLVEEKHTALAWHYRTGDAEFVEIQAQRLRSALLKVIETLPVELLQGSKVLEVRPRGVSKAEVVTRILSSGVSPSRIVAIGDDRTDEDMFMALPSESVTVHVGAGRTAAQYQLAGVGAVRALLHQIAERSPRTTEARP